MPFSCKEIVSRSGLNGLVRGVLSQATIYTKNNTMKRLSLRLRAAGLFVAFVIILMLIPDPAEGKPLPPEGLLAFSFSSPVPQRMQAYEELLQKAHENGTVRVIVTLNVNASKPSGGSGF